MRSDMYCLRSSSNMPFTIELLLINAIDVFCTKQPISVAISSGFISLGVALLISSAEQNKAQNTMRKRVYC